MAGTKSGGKLTAETNKSKYGEDYYRKIGAVGGKRKVKKGFATFDTERLQEISRRGGKVSKRGLANLKIAD